MRAHTPTHIHLNIDDLHLMFKSENCILIDVYNILVFKLISVRVNVGSLCKSSKVVSEIIILYFFYLPELNI